MKDSGVGRESKDEREREKGKACGGDFKKNCFFLSENPANISLNPSSPSDSATWNGVIPIIILNQERKHL